MFIRKIRIQNVRVLRDVTVELSPVTIFVGDNNSGKSSILDGIINFSNVGRGNFKLPTEGKYSFDALRSQAPDAEEYIEYEVDLGDGVGPAVGYLLRYSKADRSIVVEREILSFGSNVLFDRARQNQMTLTSISSVGDGETVLAAIRRSLKAGNKEDSYSVAELARSIANMMTYRLVPNIMAQPAPLPAEEDTLAPRMSGNGYGLSTVLAYLQESLRPPDVAAYDEVLALLRSSVKGFADFAFTQSDADKVEFAVVFEDSRGTIRASQLSDGTISLIGHLALLCSPSRPGVIGLEEPESGLTTKALRVLMRTIRAANESKPGRWPSQVLIATHSPYIVSWAWENLGHETVFETICSGGIASVVPFIDEHPEIPPDGALGPNAVVSAMGWHFG